MKKILAFGASSSKNSINKQLSTWAAAQLPDVESSILDLNDFEMPIFSVDREKENGIPQAAQTFKQHITDADGIIASFAEHNGSYSTAFKNIFDWASRIEGNLWQDKPLFLMSASPGGRGAQTVLGQAQSYFPYLGGKVVGVFSLPFFQKNFNETDGISNADLKAQFAEQLNAFAKAVKGAD